MDPETRLTWDQRQAQLISAARDVFIRHGIDGATTRTIAEYAGVSEGLIYRHFPSKDALIAAAITGPLEKLTRSLAAQCEQLPSLAGPQRRSTSVEIHAAVLKSMNEIAPLLGLAIFSKRASGSAFYVEQIRPLLESTTKSVAAALEGWDHMPVNPSTVVSIIFGTYFWVSLDAMLTNTEIDNEALASEITDLLVRAVRTPRSLSEAVETRK